MLCLILMYALVRIWPLSEAEVKLLSICYRFKVKYRGKYTFFFISKNLVNCLPETYSYGTYVNYS